MITMQEYINKNYEDDMENWESMTPRERLNEYLWNELNLDFGDDFFKAETIEQCINGCNKALNDKEFEDMVDCIKEVENELEKYKGKGLFCKYCIDKDYPSFNQFYVVFTEGYEYVSMIRVI